MARKAMKTPGSKPLRRIYLSNLRIKKDMSQNDVAKACNIEAFVYCQIESGKRGALMNASKILDLASAFGIPVEEFVKMEAEYLEKRRAKMSEERMALYGTE